MNSENPRVHTVEHVKRMAKNLKREKNIPHHQALNMAAQTCGFTSYTDFLNGQKK